MQVPAALQSPKEELLNTVTHGLALALSLWGTAHLYLETQGTPKAIGCVVFGASLVLLYLTSTLYHAAQPGRLKHTFRVLDHMSIYVLIAGTYTMFVGTLMQGFWSEVLLWAQWSLALCGIVFKGVFGLRYEKLSVTVYIIMGWMGALLLPSIIEQVPGGAIAWLIAGGLAYTVGVFFYVRDQRMKYAHAIWHLFVMAGSACHFCIALFHATPG